MSRDSRFDVEALLARARRETGLDDFGSADFYEPLERLLESLDREAGLNEAGRDAQSARILKSLETRLLTEAALRRHPEILEERIERPVFILGPTRSGTTRLHRMLESDPRHIAVLWWENRSPAPYPGSDWRRNDPRIEDAHEEVRQVLAAAPELAAIHPWEAEGPDEEAMLIEHAFLSVVPETAAYLPSYRSWRERADLRPGYRYLLRMLQFLQWQKRERGETGHQWILKTPMHLSYVDEIFELFPDARMIQTHRDPVTSIPSASSLYAALWALNRDEVDRAEVGRQLLHWISRGLELCMASREKAPPGRFYDVFFEDMNRRPIDVLAGIYRWLEEPFTPEARESMERWLVENARERRPSHRYRLEDFELDREEIERRCRRYRERFILPRTTDAPDRASDALDTSAG